jgi:hypothetical protein
MKNTLYITLSTLLFISACKKKENPPAESPQTPTNQCAKPTELGLYTIAAEVFLHWDDNNMTPASYYQFEYGVTGFAHGSGTVVTTSSTTSSKVSMATGNIYQFYVRGYCDATGGFSDWTGPFSYFSDANHNMNIAPSNIQYSIEYNAFGEPVAANFNWDRNGESKFECTIVGDGLSPNSGNITTIDGPGTVTYFLTQNTEYDFYVRAVFLDGTKSSWVGPKNANIGG